MSDKITLKAAPVPTKQALEADRRAYGVLSVETRAMFGQAACRLGDEHHDAHQPTATASETMSNVLHYIAWEQGLSETELDDLIAEVRQRYLAQSANGQKGA